MQFFLCPGSNNGGGVLFLSCLFVCLSVLNFNLRYNFWTVRGRDFIFGMHALLMVSFQITPRSMTLWPWLWARSSKYLFGIRYGWAHSVSQTHLDFWYCKHVLFLIAAKRFSKFKRTRCILFPSENVKKSNCILIEKGMCETYQRCPGRTVEESIPI